MYREHSMSMEVWKIWKKSVRIEALILLMVNGIMIILNKVLLTFREREAMHVS